MSYTRVNWQNSPNTSTPLSAENLNKMDAGIKQNANDIETLQQHTYDAELNGSSTNAPQNKAVYEAIQQIDIETDPTLTVSGKPADAAATGEAIANVSSAISEIAIIGTGSGKNLFNPDDSDYMAGYRCSNTTGNPTADSAWNLTGYIPLSPGEQVVISRGQGTARNNCTALTRIYAYQSDKTTFLGATYNTGLSYYTAPENCGYIRCALSSSSSFFDYQIEYGTTPSEYEPYSPSAGGAEPNPDFVNQIKTSDLDNDAGFLTESALEDISSIVSKSLVLPGIIYGFAGKPMRLYPYNFMQYSPNDVCIRYTSSNKGKCLSDRWEYTPQTAENFNLDTYIFDHSMRQLNMQRCGVQIKSASVKSSLKVMVIGDSTVQAGTETQKLLDLASADGYGVTLLGTRGTAPNLTEGRGGWTANMYVHNASNTSGTVLNAFYNPSTQIFDFDYYMTQQGYTGVDCVFIQLGINDLFAAKTDADLATAIDSYLDNMDIIVDSIHDYDSNIMIIINPPFPSDVNQDTFGDTYGVTQTVWRYRQNVYQGGMALLNHFANTSNLYVSWLGASIDVANNMGGDVHPATAGYNQLGEQMYAVMRAVN